VSESKILRFWRWPDSEAGEIVQFRLIYRGSLPSQRGGGKAGFLNREKHSIRKQLHPQLRQVWEQRWHLSRQLKYKYINEEIMFPSETDSEAEKISAKYVENGFRFLPLITDANSLACKLDILFMRRDSPGNLIESGGDIDNRIKILFDALSVPNRGCMNGLTPLPEEEPMFCLLEDDRLITEVAVTTDRLMTPLEAEERVHDVLLVLTVTTKLMAASIDNFGFLGE
jgi:hypothetical protein